MPDEVGRAAALIAGLDPKDMLVKARQRAAIDIDVLGREAHEALHDLVRVTAGHEVDLDRPGEIDGSGERGLRSESDVLDVNPGELRRAEGCRARRGVAGT